MLERNSLMERASKILELVHTDLCGPMNTPSIGKSLYHTSLIDDSSPFYIITDVGLTFGRLFGI